MLQTAVSLSVGSSQALGPLKAELKQCQAESSQIHDKVIEIGIEIRCLRGKIYSSRSLAEAFQTFCGHARRHRNENGPMAGPRDKKALESDNMYQSTSVQISEPGQTT